MSDVIDSGDMLDALLNAAEYTKRATAEIEIFRPDASGARQKILGFTIHALTEDQYDAARKNNTTYQTSRKFGGLKMAEDMDVPRYNSQLIYLATADADRTKLWDNRAGWEKTSVVNAYDFITKVLKPGEKDQIVRKIDELSGYEGLDEIAKK